jgi:hypothetical protein
LKDYYSILGLDSDASSESVKLAYRRLAREAHPDRFGKHGSEAQAQASARMAELNEAYEVLSDARRRKEFDKEFRAWQAGEAPEAPAAPAPAPEPAMQTPAPVRPRARTTAVISSVVDQLSTQFLNELLSDRRIFSWKEKRLEGFDWALEAGFLLANYHIALRGFAAADPAAAQKFTNYATLAVEAARSMLKRNFFLFLMAFQRVADLDQVQALCRRFAGGDAVQQPGTRAMIFLLDTHGHGLPCGPRIDDKRYNQLLAKLGLSR